MKRPIIAGIAITAGAAIIFGASSLNKPAPITLTNPQHVVWDKPTTDAQWAEDVKAEQIDMRSTDVLNTMLTSQTAKLEKETKANKRYQDCADCIYYDYYQQFLDNGMKDADANTEARAAAGTAIAQHQYEMEKITQSIERITRELDLRQKGFVVIEGTQKPTFGAAVPANRVRHIIDK